MKHRPKPSTVRQTGSTLTSTSPGWSSTAVAPFDAPPMVWARSMQIRKCFGMPIFQPVWWISGICVNENPMPSKYQRWEWLKICVTEMQRELQRLSPIWERVQTLDVLCDVTPESNNLP